MIPEIRRYAAVPFCLWMVVFSSACKKEPAVTAATVVPEKDNLTLADMPVLKVATGQEWKYLVTIETPDHPLSGKAESISFERIRRFIGKTDPGNGKPPADCFEVVAKGTKTTREYVAISPEEVVMLGQSLVDEGGIQSKLLWLEHPVTFFRAGLSAGDSLPLVMMNKEKNLWRVIRVIGRERIKVPAGEFDAVRLQMIGRDGELALHRTYWYCPGSGIIREEKIREKDGKPLYVETDELQAIIPGKEK